jgi:hypothetical protein
VRGAAPIVLPDLSIRFAATTDDSLSVIDVHDTIETFRRGSLDIDCTRMTLRQGKDAGPRFEGRGYLRQTEDGTLLFKLYVNKKENADRAVIFQMLVAGANVFHEDDLIESMI